MRKIFVIQIVKFLFIYGILRTFESIIRRTQFRVDDVQKSSKIQGVTKNDRNIDPDDQIKIIAVHYLESKLIRSLKNETSNLIQHRIRQEKQRIEDLAFQHAQNYHYIEKENPGVEINPIFLSSQLIHSSVPNVYASPGGSMLHTLGTLMTPLLGEKPDQNWILVSPHEDSPYLSKIKTSSISLARYLNSLDKDVKIACSFSKLYYNVSTSFVTETQARLKNTTDAYNSLISTLKDYNMTKEDQRKKYLEANDQSHRLKDLMNKLENDLRMWKWVHGLQNDHWMVRSDFIADQSQMHYGCKHDSFFIRTDIFKRVVEMDYRLYPIDSRLTNLLPTQISNGFFQGLLIPTGQYELPIFSHWLFNFIRYGMTDDIKGPKAFPRNPNYKMSSFSEHIDEVINKIPDGWIERALPNEFDLWKAGEPSENYFEIMENQLPRIYQETSETKIDFAYVPGKACKGPKRKFIALIKTSFMDNGSKGRRRSALREIFAKMLNKDEYELYFLIGSTNVRKQMKMVDGKMKDDSFVFKYEKDLKNELETFDDLVVGDFEDNYENLPIKTFLGYKFLNEKCDGKYEFATFTDDDAFIDWPFIKQYLKETAYESSSIHCLKGNLIEKFRAPYNGKYWLWHELWPSQFKPPSYCNGQCALLTSEAVSKIYTAAKITNRNNFRLEDFFYVGILRLKAGIPNPKPFIFKNTTDTHAPHYRSACYHMADIARYETLIKALEQYDEGKLFIAASA